MNDVLTWLQELNSLLILIFGVTISATFKGMSANIKRQAQAKKTERELIEKMATTLDEVVADNKKIKETLQIHQESNVAVLHNKLYTSCGEYIKRKWVTTDELNDLGYLYKSYKKQGGNGTGDTLWKRVNDLEIR